MVKQIEFIMAAKKPRSAKQKANDKRLGQAAKARAKGTKKSKSKSKRKTKTTKRKTTSKPRINTSGLTQTDINMMKKIKKSLSDKKTKSITIRR